MTYVQGPCHLEDVPEEVVHLNVPTGKQVNQDTGIQIFSWREAPVRLQFQPSQ
jgi:hypothetical protein